MSRWEEEDDGAGAGAVTDMDAIELVEETDVLIRIECRRGRRSTITELLLFITFFIRCLLFFSYPKSKHVYHYVHASQDDLHRRLPLYISQRILCLASSPK